MASESTGVASVTAVFSKFVGDIEADGDLRDGIRTAVKDIDRISREISALLSEIHMRNDEAKISAIVQDALDKYREVRSSFEALSAKIPSGQYYTYHDHWRFALQKLVFSAALSVYLQRGELTSLEDIAGILGLKSDWKEGFHLDLEDYLFGILSLASELSRYCVNRVTAQDYRSPQKIFNFISQLGAGFRLLNLKNSELRRRFDSLKYDEKKVEEVIYDLSVRGLLSKDSASADSEMSDVTRSTAEASHPDAMQ